MDQETGAIQGVNTKIESGMRKIDESLENVNTNVKTANDAVSSLKTDIGEPAKGQETVFKELEKVIRIS